MCSPPRTRRARPQRVARARPRGTAHATATVGRCSGCCPQRGRSRSFGEVLGGVAGDRFTTCWIRGHRAHRGEATAGGDRTMATRRGRGEGSVTRRADGRWRNHALTSSGVSRGGCAAFRAAVPEPISERVARSVSARALESARPYQRGQETRRAASTQEAAGVRRKGAQGLADGAAGRSRCPVLLRSPCACTRQLEERLTDAR